jgi:hypothetical protein
MELTLILYIVAMVLFFLAAVAVTVPRIHLGWLGAFFVALALVISSA